MDRYEGFTLLMTITLLALSLIHAEYVPPFFISEPSSATVVEGQNVTLNCDAGPRGSVDVRWIYNGTEVDTIVRMGVIIVKGSTLQITSFSSGLKFGKQHFSHTGVYQCIARNKFGAIISRPASLDLACVESFPDKLLSQNISAVEGNTVILHCTSGRNNKCCSSSPMKLEFNGSPLRLSARHKLMPSNSLQIENVSRSDSGTYRCSCSCCSVAQQSIFSSQHLKVERPHRDVSSQFVWTSPRNVEVIEGHTLILECAAVGWPVPLITWLRYGGVLPADRHSQNQGILSIRNVQKTDEGTYICRSENTAGPPPIHVVFVEVLQPPEILVPPVDQVVAQGNRVVFNCKTKGSPRPGVTWYYNAVPVVNNASMRTTSDGALVIAEAAENQSGIYQCIASNAVNSSSAFAVLAVQLLHRSSTGANRRRPNEVQKKASRVPLSMPPIIPYRRTALTSTTSMAFPYRPMETNAPGPVTKSKELSTTQETTSQLMQSDGERKNGRKKVKGPRTYQKPLLKPSPKQPGVSLVPPSKPVVTLLSDTSVHLKWSVGQSDGLNVTLFKVQYKEIKNRKHKKSDGWHTIDEDIKQDVTEFTVTNLKPGSTYQFRLVAIYSNNDNKHGPNSDRILMSVTGQHVKVPLTAPIIVAVHPLSDSEISVAWQFMPAKREAVDGFMISYKPYETTLTYKQYAVHGSEERQVILSHLLKDTTYSLRMQSFNAEGFSEFSNTAVKKTMGPSDNVTDGYPLHNYTPVFPPNVDDLPPIVHDDGSEDVDVPHSRTYTTRSGIESQVPLSRAPYSQQNKDLLFVVLGVVLGAVFVVVVFIAVFCFWRQRQQQLIIAALQASAKTNNTQNLFRSNGLATGQQRNYEQETANGADPSWRKRNQSKKDHIPGYIGNGSPENGGGFRSSANLRHCGGCCHAPMSKIDDWKVQRHLSAGGESPSVCSRLTEQPVHDHRTSIPEDCHSANSNYESRSDVSDSDSVTSECRLPWLPSSRGDIYNSESPQVASLRPQHLPARIGRQSITNCHCDQFACHHPLTEPLDPNLQNNGKCRTGGNNGRPGRSSSLPRSFSSDCSSSLSDCNHRLMQEPPLSREKNDSGVYDEHAGSETTSDCKQEIDCAMVDQSQAVA